MDFLGSNELQGGIFLLRWQPRYNRFASLRRYAQ
jgi:hypothetical protein